MEKHSRISKVVAETSKGTFTPESLRNSSIFGTLTLCRQVNPLEPGTFLRASLAATLESSSSLSSVVSTAASTRGKESSSSYELDLSNTRSATSPSRLGIQSSPLSSDEIWKQVGERGSEGAGDRDGMTKHPRRNYRGCRGLEASITSL